MKNPANSHPETIRVIIPEPKGSVPSRPIESGCRAVVKCRPVPKTAVPNAEKKLKNNNKGKPSREKGDCSNEAHPIPNRRKSL